MCCVAARWGQCHRGQSSVAQYSVTIDSAVQYSAVQCSAVQPNTEQINSVQVFSAELVWVRYMHGRKGLEWRGGTCLPLLLSLFPKSYLPSAVISFFEYYRLAYLLWKLLLSTNCGDHYLIRLSRSDLLQREWAQQMPGDSSSLLSYSLCLCFLLILCSWCHVIDCSIVLTAIQDR